MTIFFAPLRLPPLMTQLLALTWLQWVFFWVGWLAWTCEAIDFFSVSLSVPALADEFEKETSDITQAITVTLLFRSVGAVLFGIFSDRFGRKRPLVFNLVLVAVLELGADPIRAIGPTLCGPYCVAGMCIDPGAPAWCALPPCTVWLRVSDEDEMQSISFFGFELHPGGGFLLCCVESRVSSAGCPALARHPHKDICGATVEVFCDVFFGRRVGSSFVFVFYFFARMLLDQYRHGRHLGSTALENLPAELRGLASGVLQQGYAVGYLIAAVISLELVPTVPQGWRALFWTASGISVFGAVLRAMLPESAAFEKVGLLFDCRSLADHPRRDNERYWRLALLLRVVVERDAPCVDGRLAAESHGVISEAQKTRVFLHETGAMLKKHWMLYFNFLPHDSQDLYPTYLQKTKGFQPHSATVATIIGNCPPRSTSSRRTSGSDMATGRQQARERWSSIR
ncbi:hypothetical protein C8R43DRAFT_1193309 [Mycena crocata]|nr:hypothetical protein C8R43DRAFT_1193309 [Mycena crocata]